MVICASDFWCYFVMVLGSYKPYSLKTVNLNDKRQMYSDCSTDRLFLIFILVLRGAQEKLMSLPLAQGETPPTLLTFGCL